MRLSEFFQNTATSLGRVCSLVSLLWSGGWVLAADGSATIFGRVHFTGSVPPHTITKVLKDSEQCGEEVVIQPVKVQGPDGGLEGAVVSLEGVKAGETRSPSSEHPVVNVNCAFTPRVAVAQQGQEIEVRNQDPILHNTHIKIGKRTFLNVAQVPYGRPIVKILRQSGLYSIRCDKHTFMEGHLVVFDHPYFAVTDASGTFHLEGLPPGAYQLRVWHEILGHFVQPIEIPASGEIHLDLRFP